MKKLKIKNVTYTNGNEVKTLGFVVANENSEHIETGVLFKLENKQFIKENKEIVDTGVNLVSGITIVCSFTFNNPSFSSAVWGIGNNYVSIGFETWVCYCFESKTDEPEIAKLMSIGGIPYQKCAVAVSFMSDSIVIVYRTANGQVETKTINAVRDTVPSSPIAFGGRKYGESYTSFYDGIIESAKIYDHNLSVEEMTSMMNGFFA